MMNGNINPLYFVLPRFAPKVLKRSGYRTDSSTTVQITRQSLAKKGGHTITQTMGEFKHFTARRKRIRTNPEPMRRQSPSAKPLVSR